MNRRNRFLARTVGWSAIAVVALTTLTPLDASAGHRRWKKHRNPPRQVVVQHTRHVVHDGCGVASRPIQFTMVGGDRFYWSASVGLYVPRVLVNADFGNRPPQGCAYYDRSCDRTFTTLRSYRTHLGRSHHPEVIEVRETRDRHDHDSCSNDSDWDDD